MRHVTLSALFPNLMVALLLALLPLLVASEARGEEEAAPKAKIAFHETLAKAFEEAKEKDLPVMICINARAVAGERSEPAARELRERTYKAPAVVEKSKKFVCAFLTSEGSSDDFGELRFRYGIDGDIVSPQHVFTYPDGTLIFRREYWPYGSGQRAVDALLKLMDDALARDGTRRGGPPVEGEAAPGTQGATPPPEAAAPESGEERTAWIAAQIEVVKLGGDEERKNACKALIENDKDGDALTPLLALLAEMKKHPYVQIGIIRALGKPGLTAAVKPVAKFLGAKQDDLRANAAVTLEYIGSPEAVGDLKKRAPKEKVENIANHMYRALGRCGVGDAKVRSLLLKKAGGGKNELATYGPIIGLAYFERDPKTARAVEKLLKKVGLPGGRDMWRGAGRRALLMWCLTEVGFNDPKSAKFVREVYMPLVRANAAAARFIGFYQTALACCEGDEGAREDMARATGGALSFGGGNQMMDEARQDRDGGDFKPKGDWGGGGGGGGGRGGGRGGGGGGGPPRAP